MGQPLRPAAPGSLERPERSAAASCLRQRSLTTSAASSSPWSRAQPSTVACSSVHHSGEPLQPPSSRGPPSASDTPARQVVSCSSEPCSMASRSEGAKRSGAKLSSMQGPECEYVTGNGRYVGQV
eukprot:5390951-Prymnesium_polylepis.2